MGEEFIISAKKSPQGMILVVTDITLVGKYFEEGKRHLDLRNKFYQGEEGSEGEVRELINQSYIIHFTGKKIVALGTEIGVISSNNILIIAGVPHAEAALR